MRKSSAIVLFVLLTAAGTFAQTRARVFDNFDTSSGVQVVSPAVKPLVSSRSTSAGSRDTRKVKKTTMNVSEGIGLSESSTYSGTTLSMGTSTSLKGFTTGDTVIDSYIVTSSRRYNIDPLLIYSQMHQESAFKQRARSHKGASGLMQLMPATARRFGVTDIYDPKQNIDAGVKYMRWLLDKFNGNVVLALAGYNAGEGAVMKYGWQVPPYNETRDYVAKITRKYNAISDPSYVRNVRPVAASTEPVTTIAKNKQAESVYEVNLMAERLPDGRMRLVTH